MKQKSDREWGTDWAENNAVHDALLMHFTHSITGDANNATKMQE